MATKLKPVDVVTVGVGLTGTILAKELADTGLKVVGLDGSVVLEENLRELKDLWQKTLPRRLA